MKVSWRVLLCFLGVAVGSAFTAFWFYPRQDGGQVLPIDDSDLPPDPRELYSGPYQNIHPSVRYVGDAKCAECHLDVTLPYSEHPMGRSLVLIGELAGKQPYDKAHYTPFDALGVRMWAERHGEGVRHRVARIDNGKSVWERSSEVHFAVGSGTRGYSYFTERDGFVFQTPISWFSQKDRWDLSPGFTEISWPGRFVPTACLQCHANGVKPRKGYYDRFEAGIFDGHAIGCERCHGPGEKHVAAREHGGSPEGGFDGSIVNPARLDWSLRENVCEQCHLGGMVRELRRGRDWFDFRPGMPLEEFLFVMVANPELPGTHLAVGQVEQMHRSKCFEKSTGKQKLGCISCHDPHQRVEGEEAVRHYRARCLTCHQNKGCAMARETRLAKSPDDSCVSCHMPRARTADIAHTALTNHAIPRIAGAAVAKRPGAGVVPFVPFHAAPLGPGNEERQRDLAVALGRLATQGQFPPSLLRAVTSEMGMLLEGRLQNAPTDPAGWLVLAQVRVLQSRTEDAVEALRRSIELAPLNERALALMAMLQLDLGRPNESIRLWTRAAEINPYLAAYPRSLTGLLIQREEWEGAAREARVWAKLEPNSVEARHSLTRVLLELGHRDEARRAFDELRALRPANLDELELWFKRRDK